MNAPFNHGRPGNLRDPFAAFVCDEETAELLRPIAVEHGWSPKRSTRVACAMPSRPCPYRQVRTSCSSTCRKAATR
jgi:hypothetical protein